MAICCVSLVLRRCGVLHKYTSLLRISRAFAERDFAKLNLQTLALFEQPSRGMRRRSFVFELFHFRHFS